MAEKGNVLLDCPNASNPYHECTDSCIKRIAQGQTRKENKKSGSLILDVSRSFGRRKKERSQPNSPQVNDNASFRNTVYPSDFSSKKKVEAKNGEDFPHSPARAKETHAQEPSYKGPVQSSHSVPTSGIIALVHTLSHTLAKKELESQMEDLSLKEKEVDIAKKQVATTRARLSEFELKSSQLNETSLSIRSKIENSPGQSLLDELL
ncbi:hypothetical protein F2P56_029486 [Juglans regia]|uniref:Uncharacterized protein n=1 Tax=Juglans regia TaxID=51240 RepID=A0A833TM41_JUGRE|nr:hypothetical protein F2P56_029486 [Juglans regia]